MRWALLGGVCVGKRGAGVEGPVCRPEAEEGAEEREEYLLIDVDLGEEDPDDGKACLLVLFEAFIV